MFRSIGAKVSLAIAVLLVIGFVVNAMINAKGTEERLSHQFVAKAVAITQEAENARNYVSKLRADYSAFHDEDLLKSPDDVKDRYYWTIPVVAGWTVGMEKSEESGYAFRVPANDARNKDNTPENKTEEQILAYLEKQIEGGAEAATVFSENGTFFEAVKTDRGWEQGKRIAEFKGEEDDKLRFARAVVLTQDCMLCHGVLSDDPNGDGLDPLGLKMEGWKPGMMHGAFEVIQDLDLLTGAVKEANTESAIVAAIIVALLIAALVVMMSLFVGKPLSVLVNAAHLMSRGDYSIILKHNKAQDEIAQMNEAFIEMKNNTKALIQQVGESAQHVAAASEELSAGADETGKAVQQVSATVQEVAHGSQETTRSLNVAQENLNQNARAIQGVSKDIEEVAAYATQAAAQGSEGKKSADQAVGIINRAASSVQETASVVHSLGQKTQQIAEFITIITGIADQTNLLALNAAIEAARAGEAGRGFAVVAEEVRKLAEESNTAAGNITKLVKDIGDQMQSALGAMERSDKEVAEGASTVAGASAVLSEIVKGVEALSEKVHSISAASEQINASTAEVVNAMHGVAAIAEENSAASQEVSAATEEQTASMEEIAASANNLSKLSQDLQDLVGKFKV